MKLLFVHQNFPGQYLHLARFFGAVPGNEVVFITQRQDDISLPGVRKIVYQPSRFITSGIHHYLPESEAGVLNAQAVARVALELRNGGFVPDIMLGHNGWGEIWYLKDVFPNTPLIGYFEFFYRAHGADVDFNPQEPISFETLPYIRTKNLGNLLGLDAVDLGQCPTRWQQSLYPQRYRSMLRVIHEGIDTEQVTPDEQAWVSIAGIPRKFNKEDEIVTYVARNLEPLRGFTSFMRSLPAILDRRPNAHVMIVGGDETSYGPGLPNGQTFREKMCNELDTAVDWQRVHFLGKVPYSVFLKILQISRAHVYLTYPFVLSWSMLEAMAVGCLVIGSRTAPVEEVIQDGENGLLVDFFSPQEIAERVISALEQRNSYSNIRQNARKTIVERYDLRRVCLPAHIKLLTDVQGKFKRLRFGAASSVGAA